MDFGTEREEDHLYDEELTSNNDDAESVEDLHFADVDSLSDEAGRNWCYKCHRPQKVCLCHAIPAGALFDTATRIGILQHPQEAQRACGTVPLLQLCLQNLAIVIGNRMPSPAEDPKASAPFLDGGRRCILVCPGPGAEPMENLACSNGVEGHDGLTLVFIDGRWPQAVKMIERSPWLRYLPRAVLSPRQSAYTFRKQPRPGFVSTLEAVAEALEILEGPDACTAQGVATGLRSLFQEMVAIQSRFIPNCKDKNKLEGDFDKQLRAQQKFSGATISSDAEGQVLCICRWSDIPRGGGNRRVIVEQELPGGCTIAEALALAKCQAAGRAKGRKPWVLALSRVPHDAIWESPA